MSAHSRSEFDKMSNRLFFRRRFQFAAISSMAHFCSVLLCAFDYVRNVPFFVLDQLNILDSFSISQVRWPHIRMLAFFVCECRCSIIFKSSHSHNAHYEIVHRHSAKRSNREKNEEVFFCLKKPHFVHQTIHHVLIYALNASKLVVVVTTHFNVL